MQQSHDKLKAALGKLQMPALIAGVAGSAATAAGFFMADAPGKELFWEIYLMAFLMCLGLSGGSLGFLLISNLATGRWFHFVQRPLEAAAKNLLFCAVLFAGVWVGRTHLYHEWINRHADGLPQSKVSIHHHPVETFNAAKHWYMTDTGWQIRSVITFAIWIGLAFVLTTWSRKQDGTPGGEPWGKRMRIFSGAGILLFGLSGTTLVFDLLVALNAGWYSSIYGVMTLVSFGLTTLAFLALITNLMRDYEPYNRHMTNRHSHDIGTMMFAFTVLWTYMQAGQLIIIWNGNLLEETIFYIKRLENGWRAVDVALFLGAFVIPFLLLLSQPLKRNKKILAAIAIWVIAMRYFDWYWEILPWFRPVTFHWLMVTAPLGMLGLWFALFVRNLKANPAPCHNDPRFQNLVYNVLGQDHGH